MKRRTVSKKFQKRKRVPSEILRVKRESDVTVSGTLLLVIFRYASNENNTPRTTAADLVRENGYTYYPRHGYPYYTRLSTRSTEIRMSEIRTTFSSFTCSTNPTNSTGSYVLRTHSWVARDTN